MGGTSFEDIDPRVLILDPDNIRWNETPDLDFVRSIRDHGVVMPLHVEWRAGEYHVIAGHRRTRGAREAGVATVPCIVHAGMSPVQRLILQFVENLHRAELNPIEKAQAMKRLQADGGYKSQDELARAAGVSQATVSRLLRALELPSDVQGRIASGELSLATALGDRSAHRRSKGETGLRQASATDPQMAAFMAMVRKLGQALAEGDARAQREYATRAHAALSAFLPPGACGDGPERPERGPARHEDDWRPLPTTKCPYCRKDVPVEPPVGAASRIKALSAHLEEREGCAAAHANRNRDRELARR